MGTWTAPRSRSRTGKVGKGPQLEGEGWNGGQGSLGGNLCALSPSPSLSPFPRSLHPRSPNPLTADTLILLPSPIHLTPRLSIPHLSLSPSLSEPSPHHRPHQPPPSAGLPPSLQLHLPSLLSCQSAINTPAKDLESIQALAPPAPSSHPFLKVLEYPSSLFQAPGLGWGENGVGGGGSRPQHDANCAVRWGGTRAVDRSGSLISSVMDPGGVMETGTPQESLAPSSFSSAGGQTVLCTGPEWGDSERLELGRGLPRILDEWGLRPQGVLKGGEGYGPGFLGPGRKGSWAPGFLSLGAGESPHSWVLGKDGAEHPQSPVGPGERRGPETRIPELMGEIERMGLLCLREEGAGGSVS